MFTLILVVHAFLCIFLMLLVLVQQGKGADAGALMGSGAESILGAGGAGTFVSRLTTGIAVAFMATSILLVKMYNSAGLVRQEIDVLKGSSIVEQAQPKEEAPAASQGAGEGAQTPAEQPAAPEKAPQAPQAPQIPVAPAAPAAPAGR